MKLNANFTYNVDFDFAHISPWPLFETLNLLLLKLIVFIFPLNSSGFPLVCLPVLANNQLHQVLLDRIVFYRDG